MKSTGMEADCRPVSKSSRLPQYLAVIAATLMSFCGGTCIAWTSPALPLLKSQGKLTDAQASWVGALLSLGAVLGAPPAGYLLQRRGRRGTLLLLGAPFAASYAALLVLRTSFAWVCVARLLAGVSLGGLCVATPVYIAEVSEDSVRGELGSLLQVMFSGGILFVYLLGLAGNYNLLCTCCLVVPLLAVAIFYWMPETPHYHLARNRKQEATSSLQWLRGGRCDVSEELRALQVLVDEVSTRSEARLRDLVVDQATRTALAVSLGLLAFQQLSGVCVVLYFAESIFARAGSGGGVGALSPEVCPVVVGAVMFAASCAGPTIVARLGRRPLLVATSLVMVLSLAALGTHFLFRELRLPEGAPGAWTPLTATVVYIVAYCVGLGPLPWTIMAELLPPAARGLGASLGSSFCWLLSFAVAKCFQDLIDAFGMQFAFWLFSFSCLLAALFTYFCVPETKGKSLRQIQNELVRGRRRAVSLSGAL